ncbi:MAG: hypothetical protein PF487_11175 [Bacteroidales bacterium]|jgi:hypothetical protein|nr:hypothetical protein [Bacteroidales bacterium]
MNKFVYTKDSRKTYIVFFILLISIRFWSFQGISDKIYDIIDMFVILFMFFEVLKFSPVLRKKNLPFKINVNLFIFLPLLSTVGAYYYHDQSYYLSLLVLRSNFFWLFYYLLHIYGVPINKLIKMLLYIGVVWALINIIQQFTYPIYFFFARLIDGDIEYRAGVYRFMINRSHYGIFLLLYSAFKFYSTRKGKYLFYITLSLVGIYFLGTRQVTFAAIICLFLLGFLHKGNIKVLTIAFTIIIASLFFYYRTQLFGQYIQMTSSQLDEDYIRILAGDFYLNRFWPDEIVSKIIGNGKENGLSEYGKKMWYIYDNLHFYRNDVGIIGAFNMFGILYVINILWVNLKGLFFNVQNKKNNYLRLFFLNALLTMIMTEHYFVPSAIPFFCVIFYLLEKNNIQN